MSMILDGSNGLTTPGVVNTAGETIATTLSVTGATNLSALTTTGNTILGNASTDTLNVGNGNLVTDASGNVGIGSTSSSHALLVKRAASTSDSSTISIVSGTSGYAQLLLGDTDSDARGYVVYQNSNDSLQIASAGAERMRIDSSGVVLVGTTSSFDSGKLCIDGGNNAFAPITCKVTQTTNSTQIGFRNGNGVVGGIATNGSATTYATSSDYRLKNTIAPMMGALAKVALLKPVTYKWNADNSDGQGFIAHELDAVVPGCVTGEKDGTREEEYEVTPAVPAVVDADGVETTPAVQAVKGTRTVPSYQGIDTSFLVATLTAAIQEQQAMIIQLQADVAILKALSA